MTDQQRWKVGGTVIRDRLGLLVAVSLDVFLFSDAAVTDMSGGGGPRTARVLVVLCGLVFLGLLLRRSRSRLPVAVLICAASTVVSVASSYHPVLPVCIALVGVVAYRSGRQTVAAAAAAVGASASWVYAEDRLHHWSFGWPVLIGVEIGYLVMLVVAMGIGWWRRTADRLAETRRAEGARAAIQTERQHLARELHDIVAHAVTLMVLQASGARAVMPTDPDRARAALDVVEKTGTQAMAELRRLLTVLRTARPPGDHLPIEDGPLPPGLGDLPDLVASVQAAGIEVTVHSDGRPRPIDPSVDAAAYRIISESLTNVTKHAGVGARVDVRVLWSDRNLILDIFDNGRGAGPDARLSTGNGLLGLTERIVLVGGAFEARPRATGGYEVHATLPLPATDGADTNAPSGGEPEGRGVGSGWRSE